MAKLKVEKKIKFKMKSKCMALILKSRALSKKELIQKRIFIDVFAYSTTVLALILFWITCCCCSIFNLKTILIFEEIT